MTPQQLIDVNVTRVAIDAAIDFTCHDDGDRIARESNTILRDVHVLRGLYFDIFFNYQIRCICFLQSLPYPFSSVPSGGGCGVPDAAQG